MTGGETAEQQSDVPATAAPSTAAIAGHPLHPMIVPLPIGLLSAATASDIGYAITGDPFWARASRWLLRGGLVTGLLAALLGATDFATVRRARRPEGYAHATGNVLVVALSAASLALRRETRSRVPPLAMLLSGLAGLLLVVTGWLGGELSYRHRIGVASSEREVATHR